jgi:hypothetical protein
MSAKLLGSRPRPPERELFTTLIEARAGKAKTKAKD